MEQKTPLKKRIKKILSKVVAVASIVFILGICSIAAFADSTGEIPTHGVVLDSVYPYDYITCTPYPGTSASNLGMNYITFGSNTPNIQQDYDYYTYLDFYHFRAPLSSVPAGESPSSLTTSFICHVSDVGNVDGQNVWQNQMVYQTGAKFWGSEIHVVGTDLIYDLDSATTISPYWTLGAYKYDDGTYDSIGVAYRGTYVYSDSQGVWHTADYEYFSWIGDFGKLSSVDVKLVPWDYVNQKPIDINAANPDWDIVYLQDYEVVITSLDEAFTSYTYTDYQTLDRNSMTSHNYQAFSHQDRGPAYDPSSPSYINVSFTSWLIEAVGSFLDFEIIPGFSLSGMLALMLGALLMVAFLRMFAGG